MGSSQQDCNTQNLYENLKQREGESYRELVQRIQDTLKECQVEGLLSKKALEGHILFKASFNENDIWRTRAPLFSKNQADERRCIEEARRNAENLANTLIFIIDKNQA